MKDIRLLKQQNAVYILNPAYFLRNDLKRILLGTWESVNITIPYDDMMTFLHPYHAQLLSFFNGKKTLIECIDNISAYFKLSKEDVENIVVLYIENEKKIVLPYKKQKIFLPRNVLVKNIGNVREEFYTAEQFIIHGEIDLITSRLYKPIRITFEMTTKCYTDCIYCYADRGYRYTENRLTLERIKAIIKDAKQLGITNFDINGGEVLLHKDFFEIYKELKTHGYNPLISTKMPLSIKMLEKLKDIGITHLQISLDSVDPQILSSLLKVDDNYLHKILKMMDDMQKLGFSWQINTLITSCHQSIMYIEDLLKKVFEYKNLKKITIGPVGISLYKAVNNFDRIKPKLSMMMAIEKYIQKFSRENPDKKIYFNKGECLDDYSLLKKQNSFSRRAMCTGNQSGLVILPDGQVTICEELYWQKEFLIGCLQQDNIMDVWNSRKALDLFYIKQQDIQKNSRCGKCNIFSDCRYDRGVCWKSVQYAYGERNWDYPDPRCPESPEIINEFYLQ